MVIMVIEMNSCFALVESNSFCTLMVYCNRPAITISQRTLQGDIQSIIYKDLFETFRVRLQDHIFTGAKINLQIEVWPSANKHSFLAITAYWIDMGYEMFNTLIGFERPRGSHMAGNPAEVIVKVLNMYGIRESINCITTDNAAVNKGILLDLGLEMQDWSQEDGQIRCLAYMLNLAAQTFLKILRSEAEEGEVDLASAESDDSIHKNEVDPGTTLRKLRQIVIKIQSSNLLWVVLQEDVQRM